MNEPAGALYPSRPSDDLEELAEQLRSCFEQLDEHDVELARDLLDHGIVQVWRRVARGELSAPSTLYDACRPFRHKIDRACRRLKLAPGTEIALGAHFLLRQLRFAAEALDGVGFELRVAERRSASEREVLRTLLAELQRAETAKGEMRLLRQGQVRQRMSAAGKPTATRVGQILRELFRQGLLLRRLHPDRGGKEVAFYGLAPAGRDLCQRLGLPAPEPSSGFDFSAQLQRRMLEPRRVAIEAGATAPASRVAAFCSFNGGLGRTTAVAHAAWELAARVAGDRRVLVVDLDLDAPALDDFFVPGDLGACRGLRGLVIDFHRQPERHRAGWLRRALTDESYVLRPFAGQRPTLWYLPTGFGAGSVGEECQLARELVAREVGAADPESFGHRLAEALSATFAHTLLDCSAGLGDSVWMASIRLADHLLLYARAGETRLHGLLPLLANFLARQDSLGRRFPSVSFVSGAVRPTDIRSDASWPAQLFPRYRSSSKPVFRTLDLPFEPELPTRQALLAAKPRVSSNYLEAIGRVVTDLGVFATRRDAEPEPVLEAVLEPFCAAMITRDWKRERIIEGLLEGSRNRKLAQVYFTHLISNSLDAAASSASAIVDPRQVERLMRGIQASNQVLGHQQVRIESAQTVEV